MHFTRISITKKEVSIKWATMVGSARIEHELKTKEKALPSFVGALQAFQGFALTIMGAPDTWEPDTRVTTLNFTEDKNGRRGLMISISKRVERARGAASSITTPALWEADELEGEISDGFYGKVVDDLITSIEDEAGEVPERRSRAGGDLRQRVKRSRSRRPVARSRRSRATSSWASVRS